MRFLRLGGAVPEFVERASDFLVERVAPRLLGRRGRVPQHDLSALERQAREELDARIQQGRPGPDEWPDAAPREVTRPVPRPPVRIAAALRVVAVDVALPARTPSPKPSPLPVSPTPN